MLFRLFSFSHLNLSFGKPLVAQVDKENEFLEGDDKLEGVEDDEITLSGTSTEKSFLAFVVVVSLSAVFEDLLFDFLDFLSFETTVHVDLAISLISSKLFLTPFSFSLIDALFLFSLLEYFVLDSL